MEEPISTEPTGGAASTPDAGSFSTPAATDPGGIDGSNAMTQDSQAAAPVTEQPQAENEYGWPEDNADLRGNEGHRLHQQIVQARDFGKRVLSEKRELESQWKDWNGVKQKYGDPATVTEQLSNWDALYTPVKEQMVDEQGQPLFDATGQPQFQYLKDPATGMPKITTRPFVDSLYENEPQTVEDMMWSALSQQSADGKLMADKALDGILRYKGIDPQQFSQWIANGMPMEAAQPPLPPLDVAADLESMGVDPNKYGEVYGLLTEGERRALNAVDQDGYYLMDDASRASFLNRALSDLDRQKESAQNLQNQQAEFRRAETEFWEGTKQAYLNNVASVKKEIYGDLAKELASTYNPSEDARLNQLHQGVVIGALSSLIHPETAFAGEQLLAGLGEQVSPALQQSLSAVETYQAMVDQLTAFQSAQIPQLYERRNAGQLRQAQEALRVAKLEVKAQFSELMSKVVTALGGQQMANQEALTERLASSQSRPAFNGQAGSGAPISSGEPITSARDFANALSSLRQQQR